MQDSLPHSSFTCPSGERKRAALPGRGIPGHPPGAKKLSPGIFQSGPGRCSLPAQALGGGLGCRSPETALPLSARTANRSPTAVCFLFDTALIQARNRKPRKNFAPVPARFQKSASIDKIRAGGGLSSRPFIQPEPAHRTPLEGCGLKPLPCPGQSHESFFADYFAPARLAGCKVTLLSNQKHRLARSLPMERRAVWASWAHCYAWQR
jgi:hypothetical protein